MSTSSWELILKAVCKSVMKRTVPVWFAFRHCCSPAWLPTLQVQHQTVTSHTHAYTYTDNYNKFQHNSSSNNQTNITHRSYVKHLHIKADVYGTYLTEDNSQQQIHENFWQFSQLPEATSLNHRMARSGHVFETVAWQNWWRSSYEKTTATLVY